MTSGEDIEALIAGLQRQQISEHAASYGTSTAYTSGASALPGSRARKKLLYVDGLNFTSKHWFKSRSHWDVELAAKNIKEFVEAAERGGWSLMVFVDAATCSDEAMMKWKERRCAEVTDGRREVPNGMSSMLGEMFRACGVRVVDSGSHDNDDTLAAYAHAHGASVLSADRDFFRYLYDGHRRVDYKVYSGFDLRDQPARLNLIPAAVAEPRPGVRFICLPDALPTEATGNQAQYIRGTPSALTKHFGSNLNIPLRPLRLALYLRLRKQGLLADKTSIVEVFPNWNVHLGAFEWHRHVVDLHSLCAQTPQATLDLEPLLDSPHEAVKKMFPQPWPPKPQGVSDLDYDNHIYAMHAVVFELCVMANPKRFSLYKLVMEAAAMAGRTTIQSNSMLPPPPVEPFAVHFTCNRCWRATGATKREVDYFKQMNYSMPKACKPCREAKRAGMR